MKSTFKKILLTLSAAMLFAILLCFNASALGESGSCGLWHTSTIDGEIIEWVDEVYWKYNSTTKELVISGTGEVEFDSFRENKEIESVVIKEGVTNIDSFEGCTSLESIVIADSVTCIEDSAFEDCTSLKSVTIGKGVTAIGERAFIGCEALESIVIPDSVTTIGKEAFYGCNLKSVTFGKGLKSIGESSFGECRNLESITLYDGLSKISYMAFYKCESLASITIPDSVTNIGALAFYETSYYNNEAMWKNEVLYIGNHLIAAYNELSGEYNIGEGTKTIAGGAFSGCGKLEAVTIPDSVVTIGKDAFYDTAFYNNEANWENGVLYVGKHLVKAKDTMSVNYIIKDGTKTIVASAFENIDLTDITIPSSIIRIGEDAFNVHDGAPKVYLSDIGKWAQIDFASSSANPLYKMYFDGEFEDFSDKGLYLNGELIDNIVIPEWVMTISDYAFLNCYNLKNVTISESVTNIGKNVFYGCRSLGKIEVLSKTVNIKDTLPNDTTIWCYKNSKAHKCAESDERKFVLLDGTAEENIIKGEVGKFTWSIDKKTDTLKISGNGALPDFGTADLPWKKHLKYIKTLEYDEGITGVASSHSAHTKMETVIFPKSLKTIGAKAFEGCESLKNIELGSGVTTIGESAFSSCTELESIIIPDNVTTISEKAFHDCINLKSVTIGKGVTNIGENAFTYSTSNVTGNSYVEEVHIKDIATWCDFGFASFMYRKYGNYKGENGPFKLYLNDTLITDLVIPDDVTDISGYTFYNCDSIKSVTVGRKAEFIGAYSFAYCDNLESVIIGNGVKAIGKNAFAECEKLKNVTIGSSVITVNTNVFYNCKNLEILTLPYSVKYIEESALPDGLKEIIVYNRDCEFNSKCGLNYTHTIYGYKGSTAEAFADEIAAKFIDVKTVHKIHEYESIEDRDYCNFEKCYCGEIKAVRHIDEDKDIVCDNCKKSTNHIDVGEVVYCKEESGDFKYTAVETGTYTFKFSCADCFGEHITIVKDERGEELDCKYGSSISYPLNKGETVYWCYVCEGNSITCTLSVEHKHSYEKNETKKATCTSVGEMTYTCSCGDSYKEEIPVSGHSEVTIQGKKATCTKKGLTDGKKCSVCNKVIEEQKEIKPLGHKEVTVKAVKATYTKTGLTAGKKCKTCGNVTVKQKKVAKKKLKKATISSVKSTKAKQATVNWKTVSDATGYIVEYSTSKKFTKKTTKKVTVKKAKSKKTTLKKLKSGKKYYIRIRAYKTVGKKTVYGSYSSVKTVKIK